MGSQAGEACEKDQEAGEREKEQDEMIHTDQSDDEKEDGQGSDPDFPLDEARCPKTSVPDQNQLFEISYCYDCKPEERYNASCVSMSCALFLNAGIIANQYSSRFDRAPFVIFGKVANSQLPQLVSFNKDDLNSDICRLISKKPVEYQRKSIKSSDQRNDSILDRQTHIWDPSSPPFERKIHYLTNLCDENEMDIVGREYTQWKGVQGTLIRLFPHLDDSNMSFLFSEKGSSGGLHMKAERFASCSILFQGMQEWFVLDPSQNRQFLEEMNLKYNGGLCPYTSLHQTMFIGKKTRSRFRFVRFTQTESQVIILPPGLIHQVRSSRNSVQASYNFIDNYWCNLSSDMIHDSCSCLTKGHILSQADVCLLKEEMMSRNMEKLHGTAEGLILENLHAVPETIKFLDTLNRKRAAQKRDNTLDSAMGSSSISTVAVFSGGIESPVTSTIQGIVPFFSPTSIMHLKNIPNTQALVAHPNGSFLPSSLFFCPKCNQQFIDAKVCRDHIAGHDAKFPCLICKRTFSSKNLLSRHQQSCIAPGPFSCNDCGMVYDHQRSLDIHKNTLGKCKKNPITCGCGKKYNRQAFSNHRQSCEHSSNLASACQKNTLRSELPVIKITELASSSFGEKRQEKYHERDSSLSSSSSSLESSYMDGDSDYEPKSNKRKRGPAVASADEHVRQNRPRRKSKKMRKRHRKTKSIRSFRHDPIVEFPGSSADITPNAHFNRRHNIKSSYNLNSCSAIQSQNEKEYPMDLSKKSVVNDNDSETTDT